MVLAGGFRSFRQYRGMGFVAALGLCVALGAIPARGETTVRVRVVESTHSARLAGEGLRVDGGALQEVAVTARAQTGSVRVGRVTSSSEVVVSGRRGVVVDGRFLPGSVALVPRSDGRMDVVNVVPIEAYVERSVASEIYADWPSEALKAQAVVTRTYALYERARHEGRPYHLEDDVLSQRYDARSVPASVRRATRATGGEFVSYRGRPILAVFHSSAGGRTASATEVWGDAREYLSPVESPDDGAPDYFWSFSISIDDLFNAAREQGVDPGSGDRVEILERTDSGRVARMAIGQTELSGRQMRHVLGGRAIKSTLFEIKRSGDDVRFAGSGSGHGVGLSQWGAKQMAADGKRYDEILLHYYPHSELRSLRNGARVDRGHGGASV